MSNTKTASTVLAEKLSVIMDKALSECISTVQSHPHKLEDLDMDAHFQFVVTNTELNEDGKKVKHVGNICAGTDETGFDAINFGMRMFKDMVVSIRPDPKQADEDDFKAVIKKANDFGYSIKDLEQMASKLRVLSNLLSGCIKATQYANEPSMKDIENILNEILNRASN